MTSETAAILREIFSNPMGLLYFALVLVALFIGLLLFNPFGGPRRRHHRHHSHSQRARPSLGQRLRMPWVRIRETWVALMNLARRRARHRARIERQAEQMRRHSR